MNKRIEIEQRGSAFVATIGTAYAFGNTEREAVQNLLDQVDAKLEKKPPPTAFSHYAVRRPGAQQ